MKIRFLTIAAIEVDEAVSWYQKQTEDQNLNFLNELIRPLRVITVIRVSPLAGTKAES